MRSYAVDCKENAIGPKTTGSSGGTRRGGLSSQPLAAATKLPKPVPGCTLWRFFHAGVL